jgi:hypothetical protein
LKELYKTKKAQSLEGICEGADKWTALHWAVRCGHCEVVWWLLARGGHMKPEEMNDAKDICKKILATNADGKRGKSSPEGASTQDATLKKEPEGKAYSLVSRLLENPPFVLGPSAFYDNEEKPPLEAPTGEKRTVCGKFATTIVDFYRREERVDFLYRRCKSYDVIYGSGPEKIMSDIKRPDIRHLEVLRTEASVGRKRDPSETAALAPGRPNVGRVTGLPSEKQELKTPELLDAETTLKLKELEYQDARELYQAKLKKEFEFQKAREMYQAKPNKDIEKQEPKTPEPLDAEMILKLKEIEFQKARELGEAKLKLKKEIEIQKIREAKSMKREEPETSADLGEFQFRWFHVAANNVS